MNDTPESGTTSQEVGYGRPPRHTQFKPGQSGNPGGRPKKQGKLVVDLEAMLDGTVTVMENGKPRKMSKREVSLRKILKQAIEKEHLKSILHLIDLFERYGALDFSQKAAGGIVRVPYTMPLRMARLLTERYGHPTWTKRQMDKVRSEYLATRSEYEKLSDDDVESIQHDIRK